MCREGRGVTLKTMMKTCHAPYGPISYYEYHCKIILQLLEYCDFLFLYLVSIDLSELDSCLRVNKFLMENSFSNF